MKHKISITYYWAYLISKVVSEIVINPTFKLYMNYICEYRTEMDIHHVKGENYCYIAQFVPFYLLKLVFFPLSPTRPLPDLMI